MLLTRQLSVINFCIIVPVLKEDSEVGRLLFFISIAPLYIHFQEKSQNIENM